MMFKKLHFMLAAGLMILAWSLPARAEVKTFGPFSVDVPIGWEAKYDDSCLTMANLNPKAMLMVCSIPLKGQPFGEAVLELAQVFKAVPTKDADGDYSFEFKDDDLDMTVQAVVTEEEGALKLVGVAGDNPQMEKILDSLEEN